MESTTLVTFMLNHPRARKVELLGSWDNFSEAYAMQRDSRRGHGHWTGCHTFHDIICDGDLSDVHEKRNGGLKMGGTYWYFYRIDSDEEFHDPSQPTTSACPLLPGQTLNVLDVPRDTERFVSRSRSSSVSISSAVQTLNPDDRFQTPRPAPKPRLPRLITSAEAATASGHIFAASKRDRAWSAVVRPDRSPWCTESRPRNREIKSASTSPTNSANVLKSAFMHLKGPVSALTPSQGGRGRSRVLHGDHVRAHRTKSPSARELRMHISRPATMPTPMYHLVESPTEEMAEIEPLFMRKRSRSSHQSVRRVREKDQSGRQLEPFPERENHIERGCSGFDREFSRPSRPSHRRGFPEEFGVRRSASLGRKRAPSPLRNLIATYANAHTLDSLQIPTGIPEDDNEDRMSPQKFANELDLPIRERPRSEPATPGVDAIMTDFYEPKTVGPDFQKQLPGLPEYPVREPLFCQSETSGMEAALKALNEHYMRQHAFSPQRTAFDIPLPESPDSEEATESASQSPTFSSIKGGTSGVCTPHRLSELPEWPLQDAAISGAIPMDLGKGFDNLSIQTGSESTNSTVVPYSLPTGFDGSPFTGDKPTSEEAEPRKLTQMEQLLDEFDYLGATLI